MAKRRSNGEGTIQDLPKGKFRGVIPTPDGRFFGPSVTVRKNALPAARAELAERSRLSLRSVAGVAPTVAELFESYLGKPDVIREDGARVRTHGKLRPPAVSKSTYRLYRSFYFNHLRESEFADLRASDISARILSTMMEASTLPAVNSRVRFAQFVKAMLARGGYPVTGYKMPEREEPGIVILDESQRKRLRDLAASKDKRMWLGVCLCMDHGLRRGEACGLLHEHRYDDGFYVVQQMIEDDLGIMTVETTKTTKSKSWVPLAPWLAAEIGDKKGYVLAGPSGKPWRPSNFARDFDALIEGTEFAALMDCDGDVRGVNLHDLRHTYAVLLLESGVEITTAAELLRHSVEMLVKVYNRVRRDRKREARDMVFGKLFSNGA